MSGSNNNKPKSVTLHYGIKEQILRFNCERDQQRDYPLGQSGRFRRISELHKFLQIKYPYLQITHIYKWIKTYSWITSRQGIPPGRTGQMMWQTVRKEFAAEQVGQRVARGPAKIKGIHGEEIVRIQDPGDDVDEPSDKLTITDIKPNVSSIEKLKAIDGKTPEDMVIRLTPVPKNSPAEVKLPSPMTDSVLVVNPFEDVFPQDLPQPLDFQMQTPLDSTPQYAEEIAKYDLANPNDPLHFNDPKMLEYPLTMDNIQRFLGNNTHADSWFINTVDQSGTRTEIANKTTDVQAQYLKSLLTSTYTPATTILSTPLQVLHLNRNTLSSLPRSIEQGLSLPLTPLDRRTTHSSISIDANPLSPNLRNQFEGSSSGSDTVMFQNARQNLHDLAMAVDEVNINAPLRNFL